MEIVHAGGRARAKTHVEAHGEDALLAPLEGIPQTFHVLVGDLALGAGDLAAACVEQPRRLKLHQLVGEPAHGRRGVERVDMDAQVQRLVEINKAGQPVGVDVARIVAEPEYADVAAVDDQVRAGSLDGSRGQVVDRRARAELETKVVCRTLVSACTVTQWKASHVAQPPSGIG
ncbi:hypothetical protein [Candidatus Amarobacter glycogenicus]|uniref:hypothetical protein n=1 Tax=Candidatus Amarobacter glycogenicus TaxID=3140699 RepID=UPI002A1442C2|nr:hypothetical protein [Dehalococcoidia bacterium]